MGYSLDMYDVPFFNFFDFLHTSAEFYENYRNYYLFYFESHYLPLALKSLLEALHELKNTAFYSFLDTSLFAFTTDPTRLKAVITETLKKFYGFEIAYNVTHIKISTLIENPFLELHKIYKNLKSKQRYLYVPNKSEIYKFSELLQIADKIYIDMPPKAKYFPHHLIQSALRYKITLKEQEDRLIITLPSEKRVEICEFSYSEKPDGPIIKLNSISAEGAQKVLISYLVCPIVKKDLLEFLLRRTNSKYHNFLELLPKLVDKEVFTWDKTLGWIIDRKKANELFSSPEITLLHTPREEKLREKERTVFYTLITSGHPLEIKDILSSINSLKPSELKQITESLKEKKLITTDGRELSALHPTVDSIPYQLMENETLRDIHRNLAQTLMKKKMGGAKIPSWLIARHFELAGSKKHALKFYIESIESEMENKNWDKALQHIERAEVLSPGEKEKMRLEELKINALYQSGQVTALLKYVENFNSQPTSYAFNNRELTYKIIDALLKIGYTKKALHVLHKLEKLSKRQSLLHHLFKLQTYIASERRDDNTVKIVKKLRKQLNAVNHQGEKTLILSSVGDFHLHGNNVDTAIELYEKGLNLVPDSILSSWLAYKLFVALLVDKRYEEAFYFLEKALWEISENRKNALSKALLIKILEFYLLLFPETAIERFMRHSIEEIMAEGLHFLPFYNPLGLYLIRKGDVEKGLRLVKKGLKTLENRGDFLELNKIVIFASVLLLKHRRIEESIALLNMVKSKSALIINSKELCEHMAKYFRGVKLEEAKLSELLLSNGLNILTFAYLAQDDHSPQVERARSMVQEHIKNFKKTLNFLDISPENYP